MTHCDVSLIMTAHREGDLAAYSIESAKQTAEYARQAGLNVELVAVLDKVDDATLALFEQQELFSQIETVSFGDLAKSRNHGVQIATGNYVCFHDADDLVSANWVAAAHQFAIQNETMKPLVLHPHFNWFFECEYAIQEHLDMVHSEFSPLDLLEYNCWSALSFVERAFFLNGHQYQPIKLQAGFGYEDWHWNCETLAAGALHRVVPETLHCIRRKATGSLIQQTKQARATIRKTALFDEARWLDLEKMLCELREQFGDNGAATSRRALTTVRQCYHRLKSVFVRLSSIAIAPLPENWQQSISSSVSVCHQSVRKLLLPRFHPPQWLIEELSRLNSFDAAVLPKPDMVSRSVLPLAKKTSWSRCYPAIREAIDHSVESMLLCGQWNPERLSETAAECECVIVTDASSVERRRHPAPGKTVLSWKQLTPGCTTEQRLQLLLRLLIQLQPRLTCIAGSELADRLVARYRPAIASCSEILGA